MTIDTDKVAYDLELTISDPAKAAEHGRSVADYFTEAGRYRGYDPVSETGVLQYDLTLMEGDIIRELVDPAVGYLNEDDELIRVTDLCIVCDRHTADLRVDWKTGGELTCERCHKQME